MRYEDDTMQESLWNTKLRTEQSIEGFKEGGNEAEIECMIPTLSKDGYGWMMLTSVLRDTLPA